eukprot:TRINITY_DN6125_c0_g1_i1.p1 TRINITY_DN6125_c0_g1~~TRINITY_DN6125_c0_g1_i1.p1  ORF type:complete len:419 (-),score=32.62 TRINITY_DN6125_c0_g1_i1:81-1337(-)
MRRAETCPADLVTQFLDNENDGNFMQEFALQGQLYRNATAAPTPFTESLRTDRGGRIKYCDSQVLNYNAMACTRFDTFSLSFQKASVLRRTALITDVLITVALIIPLTVVFLLICRGDSYQNVKDRIDSFATLTNSLHGVVTFLLGMYTSTSVSRWWALRNDCIGGLWGAVDDLSLQIAAYFPSDSAADKEVRERVLRWGVLSHELVYKQARADMDLTDLFEAGLITMPEMNLLDGEPSKPQIVWSWMASYFAHLAYGAPENGGSRLPYPAMILPQLQTLACKARGCIGQSFAYTDTQVPFSYVQFLGLLVWVHNFVQVLNSANVIGSYIYEHVKMTTVVMEVFFVFFYPTFFLAILHMCQGLLNPLRSAAEVDFPRRAFTHYMMNENLAFHRGGVNPPYGKAPRWAASPASRIDHMP